MNQDSLCSLPRRRWLGGAIAGSAVWLGACSDLEDERRMPVAQRRALRSAQINLVGSTVLTPMMRAIGQQYQALHPGVVVDVMPSNTRHVIAELRAEHDVIGMSECRLRDSERDLTAFPMARDGMVFAVSPHHALTSLTERDVIALTTVETSAHKAALMRAFPRRIVVRAGLDVVDLLSWHYPKVAGELLVGWQALDLVSSLDILDQDREALVLMPLAMGRVARGQGRDLRFLSIDGQYPLERNLLRSHYRLMHPVQLLTRRLPEGEHKLFIDYCLSAQSTPIVRDFGFIPYFD